MFCLTIKKIKNIIKKNKDSIEGIIIILFLFSFLLLIPFSIIDKEINNNESKNNNTSSTIIRNNHLKNLSRSGFRR